MNTLSPIRRRLIAANIVLLGVALLVLVIPKAGAEQPTGRPRGNYTMVAGRIQGNTTHCVYILDATNQELVALTWERGQNRFNLPVGYRNLIQDGKGQHGAR